MPAWLDTLLVVIAVSSALGYLLWRRLRRAHVRGGSCESSCGQCSPPNKPDSR
jgi:hypothetical protein